MVDALPLRRILWSVDAFEANSPILRHAIHTIRLLVERFPDAKVQPVYVLSASQLNASSEIASPWTAPWVEELQPAAQKSLSSITETASRFFSIKEGKILHGGASTVAGAVHEINRYASEMGADLIVCSTHARKSLGRFIYGSFAEALMHRAVVPVVVVGPEVLSPASLDKIIFPTNFAKNAKVAFRQCVRIAKSVHASISLFHALPHPVEPVFQAGVYLLGGSWVPVQSYFSADEIQADERHMHLWSDFAQHQGVSCESNFITEPKYVADAILEKARRDSASLIVLEAQTGPFASFFLGSITRVLLRKSLCPILVMNSGSLGEIKWGKNRVRSSLSSRKKQRRAA